MERQIWLLNTTSEPIEMCITELKKWVTFKPLIPLQLPLGIATKYKSNNIIICDVPDKYFTDARGINQLIIRDAGIGDILLTEPILRTLKEDKKRTINFATRFEDVLRHNPFIDKQVEMLSKENITNIRFENFDCWEDLRSFSETHPERHTKHRTDIYNEKFLLDIKDKEPRIYFHKDEVSTLKKDSKYIYVGLQADASHSYRRLTNTVNLIDTLVNLGKQNGKNIKIVLLGHWEYVDVKQCQNKNNVIDLQGKTTIREAINVIRELDYFIGVDSGLMHVALAMHIPTVSIFTIITPKLRIAYYTGQYRIVTKENLKCVGCGNLHMIKCQHGDISRGFNPPCLDIPHETIYNKLFEMDIENNKKIYYNDEVIVEIKQEKKEFKLNILKPKSKLTMPIIVLNESKNLPRFIELVMNHPCIGRTIAIDGGSTDNTVELLQKAGAEVYTHTYIKTYHEAQAMQRNISCSYVGNGTPIFIMDIDECFSKELSDKLYELADQRQYKYGFVYRKTFNYFADINDESKRIKDFPDPQPRYYIWDWKFKFVGGAHHNTMNVPEHMTIKEPILHFEKEGKDRDALEKQWKNMMIGVKKIA